MSVEFKGRWFEKELILQCVRWYVAYPLSCRQIGEMMEERGVDVDHSTINRWVVKYAPELEKEFRKRKKPVDKEGATIDFLLKARRDSRATYCFFEKAIGLSGLPVKINIDKSGANKAAVDKLNRRQRQRKKRQIILRQVEYLNNIIEQDHRGPKRIIGPTLGFNSFPTAQKTIAGIELMHMIRMGQMNNPQNLTPAEQFYDLAG